MARTPATPTHRPARRTPVVVSRPHDAAESQAGKAADVVARGGSVSGWSFASVPVEAGVHREEKGKPPSDEEKLKEAAKKVGEAALETKAGKDLQEKVKEVPLVKAATKFLDTTVGKAVAGGTIAAGVGALAAAKQPLPLQAPAIPLDKITPGLSAKVTVEGPVNAPTFVGLSLTYKEQGPKGKKGPTEKEQIAADIARLRAQQEMFKPQAQKDQEKADEQAAIAHVLAQQSKRFGTSTLLPLNPADKPKTVEVPKTESDAPKKEQDETPVQREPSSTTEAAHESVDTSGVEGAVRGGGRALDPATRRSMEVRFGYDFSSVRIHDDASASSAAAGVAANAFTVGEDIVFGSGGFDPRSPEGRHLLAHELAHVVQQRGSAAAGTEHLHRRSVFESIGILLGLEEGTWSDEELHAYLDSITRSRRIDGSYDADNKARAIVRRWKAASPGFDLLGPQKALLIKEMLDGPTLGDDEECILDLLELSDAGDLRTIFGMSGVTIGELESDINGDNRTQLDSFVGRRFDGGRAALAAGRVRVVGAPVPAGAPLYAFSAATLDARFDSDRTDEELIALVDRFSPADRDRALHHLSQVRRPRLMAELSALGERAESVTEPTQLDQLRAESRRVSALRLKVERVLLHYLREGIPATEADLRSGTSPSDPARTAELQEALRPPRSSSSATFRSRLPGETDDYEAKVRGHMTAMVDDYYADTVTNRGPRSHTLAEFEAIGNVSKDQVDHVFGQFYDATAHPAIRADRPGRRGNLHDAYRETERDLRAMDRAQRRAMANSLLFYFFQSDSWVRRINQAHDASPRFDSRARPLNDEARILARIANDFTAPAVNVRRLNEIDRGWDASAQGRDIYVQLFRPADASEDRLLLWDMFQTLIHEYMHTLSHHDYDTYATSFGSTSNEYNTLVEGVDCVLSETVWEDVAPRVADPSLRASVEGSASAALPPIDVPHPSMRRYPSFTEALRLVDLTSPQALYAAYFLGLVDRIGGPAPAARGRRP